MFYYVVSYLLLVVLIYSPPICLHMFYSYSYICITCLMCYYVFTCFIVFLFFYLFCISDYCLVLICYCLLLYLLYISSFLKITFVYS